jgi:MoxR-like ATPase
VTSDDAHPNGTSRPSGRPWWVYRGTGRPLTDVHLADVLPEPPPWRAFDGGPAVDPPPPDGVEVRRRLGDATQLPAHRDDHETDMINAALLLRRPLLVTGRPGIGKSTLAYRVARELGLGRVLHWPITSRSTLRSGLYDYDAIGRVQAAAAHSGEAAGTPLPGVGEFVRLGPLGTALLPYDLPRVLLIDELDKSDVDLPNDLLHVFENGEFLIDELVRARSRESRVVVHTDDPDRVVPIVDGRVRCRAFPFVVITSNDEREFPAAFQRRCLRLNLSAPDERQLAAMVAAHFGEATDDRREMITTFLDRSRAGGLAADQLLNAVYLATSGAARTQAGWDRLLDALWQALTAGP